MNPGLLLGALAFGTIGIVIIASVLHLTRFLRHPDNRQHAHNVFVGDGKAAATTTADQAAPDSQLAKPLSVRLDQSIASQHEVDPGEAQTKGQRTEQFNREKAAI